MGHQTLIQFFQPDLGYERNLFCRLTAVETDHGKLATMSQLRSSATTVVVTVGGAPAPRVAPVVTAQAGPPLSVESAREVLARWIGHYL
jgi:hypothetical protein